VISMIKTLLALSISVALGTSVFGQSSPAKEGQEQQPTSEPEAASVSLRELVDEGIQGATQWLLENQQKSGAWGSHHSPRPIEVLADIPGSHDAFRVATTGLAVTSLLDSPVRSDQIDNAIDHAIDHIMGNWNVRRVDGMEHYNVWTFGYLLEAIGKLLQVRPDHSQAGDLRQIGDALIEKLLRYQDLDGGWGYLSLAGVKTYKPSFTSMSFTTATILIGLHEAKKAGLEIPERMLSRALKQVDSCRTPLGSYTYGKLWNRSPARGINDAKGGACRTPLCDFALERFGHEVDDRKHITSLNNLLIKHARFQKLSLKRPIPHESWYAISGYFYLYGHAYAAYVLDELPLKERERLAPPLAEAVLHCRQPDGSFWDYPLYSYHKPYGTAFALIALTRLDEIE
jgi:hypothetical protein